MNKRTPWITLAVLLHLAPLGAGATDAQPLVYDGFADYETGGPIMNRSGGFGFATPWGSELTVSGSGGGVPAFPFSEVLAESLTYSDGVRTLVTTGGSLWLTGANGSVNLARRVDPDSLPHDGPEPWSGKVTYISFLLERGGEPANPDDPVYQGNYPWGENLYPRAASLSLTGRDGRVMRYGNLSNTNDNVWRVTGEDLYGGERGRDARSTEPFGGATTFVVIKILHGAGGNYADRFNVWFNPVLASESSNRPPMLFDWQVRNDPHHIAPDIIGLMVGDGSGNRPHVEVTFDELRLGTSWEAVTPHTGGTLWGSFPMLDERNVFTGDRYLGWLAREHTHWSFSWTLGSWIYLPDAEVKPDGGWFYLPDVFGADDAAQ